MWSADDNDLDRAIDAVARRMTSGEPSGSLRARVVDRLGERRTTRRFVWIGVPVAAAAAAIVLALLVARDRHVNVVTPAPTVAHDRTAPPAAPPTTTTTTTPPSTSAATDVAANVATPARGPIRAGRPATASPSAVAALAPDVLDVKSIQLNAIEPAGSIRLPRLDTIEPIAVQPIGEPQGDRP